MNRFVVNSDDTVDAVRARKRLLATVIHGNSGPHHEGITGVDGSPHSHIAVAEVGQIEERRHLATSVAESAVEEIRRKAPGLTVTTKVVEGNPEDAIVEESHEWGADLIIVGSHGYRRLKRMVLGSVAGAVVAKCPLLGACRSRETRC